MNNDLNLVTCSNQYYKTYTNPETNIWNCIGL